MQAWAWNYLGLLYDFGRGVAQDYVKARKYYEKAAEQDTCWGVRTSALQLLRNLNNERFLFVLGEGILDN